MYNEVKIFANRNGDGVKYQLDLSDGMSIAITKQLSDVRDYGKKKSNFTKTLVFPSTKANNKFFSYAFNVNRQGGFDVDADTPCWIVADDTCVMSGNLVLTTVNNVGDGVFEYECNVYGGIRDIITAFADDYLVGNFPTYDSDGSVLRAVHDLSLPTSATVSISSITQSFTATYSKNKVIYGMLNTNDYTRWNFDPLLIYPNTQTYEYTRTNLLPNQEFVGMLYFYDVIDELIKQAGFTWTCSLKNEAWFKKILMYNPDTDSLVGTPLMDDQPFSLQYATTGSPTASAVEANYNGVVLTDKVSFNGGLTTYVGNDSMIINANNAYPSVNRIDTQEFARTVDNAKKQVIYTTIRELAPLGDNFENTYVRTGSAQTLTLTNRILDQESFTTALLTSTSTSEYSQGFADVVIESPANRWSGTQYTEQEPNTLSFNVTGFVTLEGYYITSRTSDNAILATGNEALGTYSTGGFNLQLGLFKGSTDISHGLNNRGLTLSGSIGATALQGTFSITSDFTRFADDDTLYVAYDTQNRYLRFGTTLGSGSIPPATLYTTTGTTSGTASYTHHKVRLKFEGLMMRSTNRPHPRGLLSFNCDQKVRVSYFFSANNVPAGSQLRFVDIGENGDYKDAFDLAKEALYSVPDIVSGNIYAEYFTVDVQKGYNRYAWVLAYPTSTFNTDVRGTILSGVSNSFSLQAIKGHSFSPFNNAVFLPPNVKKVDFFLSFLRMFNLYVQIDPSNDKNLLIETYDEFFNEATSAKKDWTDKIDATDIKIEYITEYLANTYRFTYATDGDTGNEEYSLKNKGRIYGDKVLTNGRRTNVDEIAVELLFSPTTDFISKGWQTSINPNGYVTLPNVNGAANTRLFFKGDVINLNTTSLKYFDNMYHLWDHYFNGDPTFGGDPYTYGYPWLGTYSPVGRPLINHSIATLRSAHYNVQIDNNIYYVSTCPSLSHYENVLDVTSKDLNFDSKSTWTNNLYNLYYSTNTTDLLNAKLITANFHLTPTDVASFMYSDIIYFQVNGFEYKCRVNKIKDYNPCDTTRLTTVELITL